MIQVPFDLRQLEFHQCHFFDTGFYNPRNLESNFNYHVARLQPPISDPSRGPVLTLEEWTSTRQQTEPIQEVILQVLNIVPMYLDGYGFKHGMKLHELVLVVWACRSDSYLGFFGAKGRLHLSRLKTLRLFVLLDHTVSHSVLHLFKKGHLAYKVDLQLLDDLIFMSELIEKKVESITSKGQDVYFGQNSEQALLNYKDYTKAHSIRTMVFGNVDFCFASLGPKTVEPHLADIRVCLPNNLDSVVVWRAKKADEDE